MNTNYTKKGPGREVSSYPAENKNKIGPTFAERVRFNVAEEGLIRASRQLGLGYNEAAEYLLEWASSAIATTWSDAYAAGARSQLMRPKVVEIRRGRFMPPMSMARAA